MVSFDHFSKLHSMTLYNVSENDKDHVIITSTGTSLFPEERTLFRNLRL